MVPGKLIKELGVTDKELMSLTLAPPPPDANYRVRDKDNRDMRLEDFLMDKLRKKFFGEELGKLKTEEAKNRRELTLLQKQPPSAELKVQIESIGTKIKDIEKKIKDIEAKNKKLYPPETEKRKNELKQTEESLFKIMKPLVERIKNKSLTEKIQAYREVQNKFMELLNDKRYLDLLLEQIKSLDIKGSMDLVQKTLISDFLLFYLNQPGANEKIVKNIEEKSQLYHYSYDAFLNIMITTSKEAAAAPQQGIIHSAINLIASESKTDPATTRGVVTPSDDSATIVKKMFNTSAKVKAALNRAANTGEKIEEKPNIYFMSSNAFFEGEEAAERILIQLITMRPKATSEQMAEASKYIELAGVKIPEEFKKEIGLPKLDLEQTLSYYSLRLKIRETIRFKKEATKKEKADHEVKKRSAEGTSRTAIKKLYSDAKEQKDKIEKNLKNATEPLLTTDNKLAAEINKLEIAAKSQTDDIDTKLKTDIVKEKNKYLSTRRILHKAHLGNLNTLDKIYGNKKAIAALDILEKIMKEKVGKERDNYVKNILKWIRKEGVEPRKVLKIFKNKLKDKGSPTMKDLSSYLLLRKRINVQRLKVKWKRGIVTKGTIGWEGRKFCRHILYKIKANLSNLMRDLLKETDPKKQKELKNKYDSILKDFNENKAAIMQLTKSERVVENLGIKRLIEDINLVPLHKIKAELKNIIRKMNRTKDFAKLAKEYDNPEFKTKMASLLEIARKSQSDSSPNTKKLLDEIEKLNEKLKNESDKIKVGSPVVPATAPRRPLPLPPATISQRVSSPPPPVPQRAPPPVPRRALPPPPPAIVFGYARGPSKKLVDMATPTTPTKSDSSNAPDRPKRPPPHSPR